MHGAIVACSAEGIPFYSQITRLFFKKLRVGIHSNWKKEMYLMVETPSWLQYRCKRLGGVQTLIMYYLCFELRKSWKLNWSLEYPVINQNEIRCWWRANYQSFNSNHKRHCQVFPKLLTSTWLRASRGMELTPSMASAGQIILRAEISYYLDTNWSRHC